MSKSIPSRPKLVILLGPTASGKTELGIRIARRFGGEIICADSRTIYRGMDIGTSKPTKIQRRAVPHHLLDLTTPNRVLTLHDWQQLAFNEIDLIIRRGHLPLLVGGTGLYLSSIIENYRIPHRQSGPRYDTLILGITTIRSALNNRINKRVELMARRGLAAEVRVLSRRYGWKVPAMTGIGYREWKTYFEKTRTKKKTISAIQSSTRSFAKRQMTWFRGIERKHDIHWITSEARAKKIISKFLEKKADG